MNKAKKILMWLYILMKKLLCRWSFLTLLLLIILIIPGLCSVFSKGSGIVKIALCNEDEGGISHAVIDYFSNEKSVVEYCVYDCVEDAEEAVRTGKCDGAWIFDTEFEERMNKYLEKRSITPFVKVLERQDSVSLRLAREKLFGVLYSQFSYKIFSDYIKDEFFYVENIDDTIREYCDRQSEQGKLIEIKMIGSENSLNLNGVNYLQTPLRGLMSLMIMLCGFTAAGLFMKEREDGIYDRLSSASKIIPAFGSCFAAVFMASVTALLSLYFGGLSLGFLSEMRAMTLFVFGATWQCVFFTACFKDFTKFGSLIPFLMISMLVLCPIFLSLRFMRWAQFMFAPYYYLMSVHNTEYLWYMIGYTVVAAIGSWILYSFRR